MHKIGGTLVARARREFNYSRVHTRAGCLPPRRARLQSTYFDGIWRLAAIRRSSQRIRPRERRWGLPPLGEAAHHAAARRPPQYPAAALGGRRSSNCSCSPFAAGRTTPPISILQNRTNANMGLASTHVSVKKNSQYKKIMLTPEVGSVEDGPARSTDPGVELLILHPGV
jgi:hypothetical protein